MSKELDDILRTMESICEDEYPEIPFELVEKIVEKEYETLEDRDQSQREISGIIDSYFEEEMIS